jgi:maltooligosyltrehalose trehalohydrolase
LNVYHVDGVRYDCVPNYWDGPLGRRVRQAGV